MGVSVDLTKIIQEVSRNHTITLYWHQKGGHLEASVDAATIVNKALNFASEVEHNSVVCSVLLVDYKTLPAPEGTSWVDLQAAKETLQTLMADRREALTKLNAVTYVMEHPEQFQQPLPSNLNDVANELSVYINKVTNYASKCANNPTQWQLPSDLKLPIVTLPERIEGTSARPTGTVPLYRLYTQVGKGAHFFTTSAGERDNAIARLSYQSEDVACYVYATQVEGTVPLYRLYHPETGTHYYTTSAVERDSAIATWNWQGEGTACYVYTTQIEGTVPLYHLYHPGCDDHFYTISAAEAKAASDQIQGFYQSEGTACYVYGT